MVPQGSAVVTVVVVDGRGALVCVGVVASLAGLALAGADRNMGVSGAMYPIVRLKPLGGFGCEAPVLPLPAVSCIHVVAFLVGILTNET